MHHLPTIPRRPLLPRTVLGPDARRIQRETYDAVGPFGRARIEAVRRHREAREEQERPTRAQTTRERLNACHWAGWDDSRRRGRWLKAERAAERRGRLSLEGPKWLGSRGRPIARHPWPRRKVA